MHAIRVRMSARVAAAVVATALTAGGIVAAAGVASAVPKPKADATRLSIRSYTTSAPLARSSSNRTIRSSRPSA